MNAEAAGVFLDYSKNRITDETLRLLLDLAERSGLRARIDAMFKGEKINTTENRAALHIALRAPKGSSIEVDGRNVAPEVHAVRQRLPTLDRFKYAPASGVSRGAYVLADAPGGKPEAILIASGSEVILAIEAHEQLSAAGIRSRVVSMPSWDIFEHQPKQYRDSVLPPDVTARVAIEQASTFGWERYVGWRGRVIGMKTFGASAPLKELQKKFGFEPDHVVDAVKELLGKS